MTETTIDNRLRDTSAACLEAFAAWDKNRKDKPASKALHAAVHELRKVASRLEIELAASERDNGSQKPIKPPTHKTALDQNGEKASNGDDAGAEKKVVKTVRRTRKPRTSSSENAA